MATELAKAYVQIIPSAQGISGGISDILGPEAEAAGKSSGQRYGSAFSGGVSKGIAAVAGVASMAVAGITALGTSIVDNAKETASYGDNVDKLSQKIGISAEAFQEWDYVFSQNGADISILQTGMKKLSSSFADAASGSKSAQAKFAALGLSMSDIAGLSQEDLFSTVVARLQEMGPSAERTALASDLLGKSATELGPLLNQTAAETEALKQQARDLGLVMSDEAVAASAAFTDAMDNLSRAATAAKNQLSAEFLPALTDITNGFANLIAGNENATEQLKSGFSGLGDALQNVIPKVTSVLTTMVSAVAGVAPDIIQALSTGIIQALPQLTASLMEILPQMTGVFLQMLPQLVDVGSKMLIEIGNGIAQALPTLIPQVTECIMDMIDAFVQNIPAMIDVGVQIILALAEGIINALPQLIEKLPEIITHIVEALADSLPILIQGAIQLVTMLAQSAPQIIQAFVDALPVMITSIANALSDPQNAAAIIMGLIQLFIAVAAAIPQICMALIQAIPQVVVGIIEAFMQLGPQLTYSFAQMIQGVAPVFSQFATFASEAWSKIQGVFAGVGAWFGNQFRTAVAAVKNAWNGISSFFKGIWDQVVNVFQTAYARFKEIGTQMVNGIKEGIFGSWEKLKSFLSEACGDLINLAKRILGIASPSKEFAEQVGQWIPAGIALGISNGMPTLTQAIDDMTGDMLSNSVQTTLDSVNNVNYVPSSPVATDNNKAVALLAEYLPLIADGMNVDVTVRQNDRGVFEAVRSQNNQLVAATGYHALA